jgi:hypothetical protein
MKDMFAVHNTEHANSKWTGLMRGIPSLWIHQASLNSKIETDEEPRLSRTDEESRHTSTTL